LPAGKLEHRAAHRVAPLALHQQAPVGQQRHDHDRARMDHVLALRDLAVGQPDLVAAHVEEAPR
jgi:hypothetical protein